MVFQKYTIDQQKYGITYSSIFQMISLTEFLTI